MTLCRVRSVTEDTAAICRLEKLGKHQDFHQQAGKSENLRNGSERAQALPLPVGGLCHRAMLEKVGELGTREAFGMDF